MELAESYSATVQGIDTLEDTIQLLTDGRIDATLTDAVVADIGFLQTPKNTEFAFAGDSVIDDKILGEGIAIGLRKDDPELSHAINGALAAMHKNGTYDAIQKKYFSFDIYN